MEEKKDNEKDLEEKQEEKEKEKDKEKKKAISDEDLEFMISEVENRLGIDRSQFKIIKHKKKPTYKDILFDIFLSLTFNVLLIMSITGFIEWAKFDSPWDVLIFALFFSILEIGIKYMLLFIFRKRLMRTMLLIMTLPTLLAILLSLIINQEIGLARIEMTENVYLVLFVFVIFIITRNLLKGFIIRRRRRNIK